MKRCPECGHEYGDHVRICPRDGTLFVREEAPTLGVVLDGKYRLEAIVGRGAMGTVYRASHVMLGTPLAIKIINPSVAGSPEMVRRFYREARAASQLQHPYIAQTFDLGHSEDGTLYLAMEFVGGGTLRELLGREGALPPSRAIPFVRQIATALALAHAKGIVHRDLKPQNIMLAPDPAGRFDVAKLVDFGIAKTFDDAAGLTASGMMIGTPAYMSPEQINGAPVDARSDLYSFGVVIYEMLAGEPPFTGATTTAVTMKHLHEAPVPPSARTPGGYRSPLLEHIALKLLQKDPEDRYQTAGEVLDALDAPDQRQEEDDRFIAVPSSTRRWQRPAATIAGLLAVGLAAVWVAGFGGSSTAPTVAASRVTAAAPDGCTATLFSSEPMGTVPGTGGSLWNAAVAAGFYELRTVCVDGRTDTRPVEVTNVDLRVEVDLKGRETFIDRAVEGCHPSNPRALGVSDDGRRIFYAATLRCSDQATSSIIMIDRSSDTVSQIADVRIDLLDVNFGMTRTGSHIAFTAAKGLLMVYGVDDLTEQPVEVGSSYSDNLTLSDDGRYLAAQPYGHENAATAFWLDRDRAKASILPGNIAAVSRDGRWIAASRGRKIVLIERATGVERVLTAVAGDEGLARFVDDNKSLFVAAASRFGDLEGQLVQLDTGAVESSRLLQTVMDLGLPDTSVSHLASDGGVMLWLGARNRAGVPRGLSWLAPTGGPPALVFDKADVETVASSSDGAYVVATTKGVGGQSRLLVIDRPRGPVQSKR